MPPRLPVIVLLFVGAGTAVRAQNDWVIDRLAIQYDIQPDGSVLAMDTVDADFSLSAHHGIYRDFVVRQEYEPDPSKYREYDISLQDVTSSDVRHPKVETQHNGALLRFKIGDPNKTITGLESYEIRYRLQHVMNAFADHDELYWNATGTWQVPITSASVVVHAPRSAINRVECFEGPSGSQEKCEASFTGDEATFAATRMLRPGDQMTIVTFLAKGAVTSPTPKLVQKPRELPDFFDRTPALVRTAYGECALALGLVAALVWRVGRDRHYVSMHYLTNDATEERLPLFKGDPIVVEFEPPEKIRPAEIGLLDDESADTLDMTATIIDLAARGYLKITEIPKQHWFSHVDWQLDQLEPSDATLLDYERIILDGLFSADTKTTMTSLRNKFYKDLDRAKSALYQDGVTRGWFPRRPDSVRGYARAGGFILAIGGVGLMFVLGLHFGMGLLGLPVIFAGILLLFVAGWLPRRSAAGREMYRRALGFGQYIITAEKTPQAFAERANIFTAYLPYAIVFKCVDKWARAFKDVDLRAATAGWYVGSGTYFDANSFTTNMGSFSSAMSSAIASTPGGSGGSGGGGSSGGGGGGGGGGGW